MTAEEMAIKAIPQRYRSEVIDLMKEYAKQVAEQALKDAFKKAEFYISYDWGEIKKVPAKRYRISDGFLCISETSIRQTPIVTP